MIRNADICTMDIVILAATEREMRPVRQSLEERLHSLRHHRFDYIVTGVGILHATHAVTRYLSGHRPDLAVQVGIAGTFRPGAFPPGSAAAVHTETLGDAGVVEVDGAWKDLFDLGLADAEAPPYLSGRLVNPHRNLLESTDLALASGVTVNRVSSEASQIERLMAKLQPDLESMEGAPFHYACLSEDIPFLQLRGVSNTVGERDKRKWMTAEAMDSLQEALAILLLKFNETGRP